MIQSSAVQSLEAYLLDYENALTKLEKHGVRVRVGRLASYKRTIREAAGRDSAETVTPEKTAALINALNDSRTIIDIAQLSDEILASGIEKLELIVGGPDFQRAGERDSPRDYAFELAFASYLNESGWLRGIPAGGDVLAGDGEDEFPVECKRLSSARAARKRLREGRQQLKESPFGGTGVIALDVTTPNMRRYDYISAADEYCLGDEAEERLRAFAAHHVFPKIKLGDVQRPEILGIVLRYVAIGVAGDVASVRRCVVTHFAEVHDPNSTIGARFERFTKLVGQGQRKEGTRAELDAAAAKFRSFD